eukprot:6220306-Amphidinium_carterae.1
MTLVVWNSDFMPASAMLHKAKESGTDLGPIGWPHASGVATCFQHERVRWQRLPVHVIYRATAAALHPGGMLISV